MALGSGTPDRHVSHVRTTFSAGLAERTPLLRTVGGPLTSLPGSLEANVIYIQLTLFTSNYSLTLN